MSTVEEMMCVVCVSVTKGNSGDGCDLTSTLWMYDLRKGYFFCSELRPGSISLELVMCGGGVRSILL